MLTLGWSDGQTFLPAAFQMLASGEDKNILEGSHVREDQRTLATKRRNNARKDKLYHALRMLEAVKGAAFRAKHVLFDSWFASPSFLLSVGVEIRHLNIEERVPAKLVFVRDRSNRKKWIALISTDVSLSDEAIIALYGKRWDIEPYHKIIKSCLKLEKEFQVRSFDAITAHAAIVLLRYIFLSLENRERKDPRTLGVLFHSICEELEDISFAQAITLLICVMRQHLSDRLKISKEFIEALIGRFMDQLPAHTKRRLVLPSCES